MRQWQSILVRISILTLLIPIGLSTRSYPQWYPVWIARYGGDTLWATLVTLLVAICLQRLSIAAVAVTAAAFSLFIELSQLYHSPWLDTIRETFLGGLVLGFDFLWSDLVCYTIGIGIGAVVLIATTASADSQTGQ